MRANKLQLGSKARKQTLWRLNWIRGLNKISKEHQILDFKVTFSSETEEAIQRGKQRDLDLYWQMFKTLPCEKNL